MASLTYAEVRAFVQEDYEDYQGCLHPLTFEEASCRILADYLESVETSEADKVMAYVVLALVGLERGNLVDLVREGVVDIMRRGRLSELGGEFSAEDYAAISCDLERIKAELGRGHSPASSGTLLTPS